MSTEPIRTAILGYGRSGGSMHAGARAANPDFRVVAACDIDPAGRERAAQRFGCAVYDDYRAMLSGEQLDFVCVITRNNQHAVMACDCLTAGVDVLVTKPWAVNAAEAESMIAAAARSGRRLLPWLPSRWGCELRRLRELVGQGAVGKVFLVRRTVGSFGTRCDWQTERRHAGGYLLNWGPHVVDQALQLAGGRPASVFGRLRQTINPGDVEDVFLAVVTMADGVIVQAEYTVTVARLPDWIVQGDRGTIVVQGGVLRMSQAVPARPDDPTAFKTMQQSVIATEEKVTGEVYGDEHAIYREIAAALRGQTAYPTTPQDALGLTRVLDAIRASSEEDRVVRL